MQGSRTRVLSTAVVLVSAALAGATVGRAQSGGGESPDVLRALLVEVRGLRAAMERMVAAGPGIQLGLGRLQLQEQRVHTLVRRVEELRGRVRDASRQLAEHQEQGLRLEEALRGGSVADRSSLERELVHLKRVLTESTAELQHLQSEEMMAAQELATEQSRWTQINQRLEELERTLGGR